MGRYVIRRLLQAIPVLFGATFIIFAMVFAIPGDPIRALGGEKPLPESVQQALREEYHLDDPLWRQYQCYVVGCSTPDGWDKGLVQGDFGTTFRGRPVTEIMAERFPVTIKLALMAFLFEAVIGLTAGVLAGLRRGSFMDNLVLVTTTAVVAIPVFVLGFTAQILFGVKLQWFPVAGIQQGLYSFILPAMVLASLSLVYVARLTRTSLVENLRADYVRTATSKGLSRTRVVGRHAMRNSLIPVITFLGVDLGALMGGAIITESIFNLPGIGREVFLSIQRQEGSVVVGIVTAGIIIFIIANLIVDLLYAVLDPPGFGMSDTDGTQGNSAPQGTSGGGATEVDVIRDDSEGGAELLPGAAGQTAAEADQLYGGGFTAAGQESAITAYAGVAPERQASLWGDAWRQLRRKPLFIVSALLVLLFTVMAIAPGLFTSQDPRDCNLSHSLERPSAGHWFGYDLQGCDYYSMTIYGTRPSLAIGLLVVFVDALIAVVLGCIAAYFGGAYDTVIARTADIFFAIPITLGGIVILNVLQTHSLLTVSLVLVILGWPTIMRLMRSTVLATKEVDYVAAARALGASHWRVLSRHIVPNAIAPVIVYSTISVGIIISAEAALSFLGVGLQLPAISWGLMIAAAQSRVLTAPYLLLFPSLFLSMLVLSFILMGDALRDALDPKLR